MKILKKKIQRAKSRSMKESGKQNNLSPVLPKGKKIKSNKPSNIIKQEELSLCLKLKNCSKNYGRAICNFILSSEAKDTYNQDVFTMYNIDSTEFLDYITEKKDVLNGIKEFRAMLLITPKDDEKTIAFKKAFQKLSEIFIKYYSVSWIFSGKVIHKMEYLRCRNKMLRRVQNPQYFTYLK